VFADLAGECKTRPMKRILLRAHTKVPAENKTTWEGGTKQNQTEWIDIY
jgi:hypothetical protein